MRFKEVLNEVPISDIQTMGDPDPEIDQDYADPDEGMFKAWTEPENETGCRIRLEQKNGVIKL